MMRQGKQGLVRMVIFLVALALSSCTYSPSVVYDYDNATCNLRTQKRILTLETPSGFNPGRVSSGEELVAVAAIALVYSTATAVISGSIVLVGNTVHWLEKQGKCPDGIVSMLTRKHNAPLLKEGGRVLKPEQEVEL